MQRSHDLGPIACCASVCRWICRLVIFSLPYSGSPATETQVRRGAVRPAQPIDRRPTKGTTACSRPPLSPVHDFAAQRFRFSALPSSPVSASPQPLRLTRGRSTDRGPGDQVLDHPDGPGGRRRPGVNFNEQVTFSVSTTVTDRPMVRLYCYQNGAEVYWSSAGSSRTTPGHGQGTSRSAPTLDGGRGRLHGHAVTTRQVTTSSRTFATTTFHVEA